MKLVLVLSALLALSCSFEYDQVTLSEEERENTANVELENFTEQVFDGSVRILELSSDRVRVFERRRIQEIEGLAFSQFDNDGDLTVEGTAGYASRDLDSDDILLSQEVYISIPEQNVTIIGEEFLYSPDQDLVWSPRDATVMFEKADGTRFVGQGFLFDILLQELRFDGSVEGVLVEDSN